MDREVYLAGLIIFGILMGIGFLLKGERFSMYQEATGKTIEVKRGFSFTYYFFGPFVPLFRGHIGGFFLTLFVELCSCGTARLILLFCYNGMYINWLANNGFRRLGTTAPASGTAPANIQVIYENMLLSDGAAKEPAGIGSRQQKYQEAGSVIAPVNGDMDGYSDDDETVALCSGALRGIGGMYQGAEIPLDPGDSIIIGRDGEKSNLVISETNISRKHCEILYDSYNRIYTVYDNSTNGVYLENGSQIGQHQAVPLQPGTVIRVGNTDNVFLLE